MSGEEVIEIRFRRQFDFDFQCHFDYTMPISSEDWESHLVQQVARDNDVDGDEGYVEEEIEREKEKLMK